MYRNADIKGTIKVDNPLRHIRGYYRRFLNNPENAQDGTSIEDGFIIIEEENSGVQTMRRYVLSYDEELNPSMALAGLAPLGTDKVVQLEVNNKFIAISQPSASTIKFYQTIGDPM